MALNYDRQYRLIAGLGNKVGFSVGEISSAAPVPLHITFSIQKSDLESQNTGKIEIWNLSKAHIAELEKRNCIVGLKAGYGNNLSLIFSGYTTLVSTVADGADRKTTIEVLDSLTTARDSYISLSFNGKVSWKTIFNAAAAKMGVSIVYGYNVQFANVSNGFSFVGLAKNVLSKGCACCGLSWSIQNGILHIKRRGDSISRQGYVISANTGMIGMPERVSVSDSDDSSITRTGYDVKYFLNGAINVDDYVKLESEIVTGYFYVYSLEISGDSLKGDWICKARLLELTNTGKKLKSIEQPKTTTTTTTTKKTTTQTQTFKKGDKVRVRSGAKTYNGGGLASFVYTTVYTVIEAVGDRIVFGINGQVTAAVHAKDLYKA